MVDRNAWRGVACNAFGRQAETVRSAPELKNSRKRVRSEPWGVLSFRQAHRFEPQFVHLTDGCLKLRRSRTWEREDLLEASGKLFGLFRESLITLS